MQFLYVIRIKRGSRYEDLARAEFATDIDALDWFNSYPLQPAPTLLKSYGRIITKRKAND